MLNWTTVNMTSTILSLLLVWGRYQETIDGLQIKQFDRPGEGKDETIFILRYGFKSTTEMYMILSNSTKCMAAIF